VIVNMHDVELARRYADRIVGMAGGKVVFDGPPAELSDAVLQQIYGGSSGGCMTHEGWHEHRAAAGGAARGLRLEPAPSCWLLLVVYSVWVLAQIDISAERLASGLKQGAKFLCAHVPAATSSKMDILSRAWPKPGDRRAGHRAGHRAEPAARPAGGAQHDAGLGSWPARACDRGGASLHPVIAPSCSSRRWASGAGRHPGALVVAVVGFIGKLFAEAIEEISPKQVEAVRATGASFMNVVLFGVLPQVLARFIGFAPTSSIQQPAQLHHGGHRRRGRHRRHAVLGLPALRLRLRLHHPGHHHRHHHGRRSAGERGAKGAGCLAPATLEPAAPRSSGSASRPRSA
jgi:hypothetical protein